jgi:hypothetical protein
VVAISATNLHSVFVDLGALGDHFREQEPWAIIGHSIFVYRSAGQFNLNFNLDRGLGRGIESTGESH